MPSPPPGFQMPSPPPGVALASPPAVASPPSPLFASPPVPVFDAPPAPVFASPPVPVFASPPVPVFDTTPAPVFASPPVPVFDTPPAPVFASPPGPVASPNSSFDITANSIVLPEDVHETSIQDANPGRVPMTELQPEFQVLETGSERGKKLLVIRAGYSYTVRKSTASTTYWWCSIRQKDNRCPASVIQKGDDFKHGMHQHNHQSTSGMLIKSTVNMKANSDELKRLFDYFRRAWIENSTYRPSDWCQFGVDVRTNNDLEAWHKRLNQLAGKKNKGQPFYLLVPLLHGEASFLDLQVRLVTDNLLSRRQTRRQRSKAQRFHELWDQYSKSELTPSQLLREMSRLNGPVIDL